MIEEAAEGYSTNARQTPRTVVKGSSRNQLSPQPVGSGVFCIMNTAASGRGSLEMAGWNFAPTILDEYAHTHYVEPQFWQANNITPYSRVHRCELVTPRFPPKPEAKFNLESTLQALLEKDFAGRVRDIWPGKEEATLAEDPLILQLSSQIAHCADPQTVVEEYLDGLCIDIKAGEMFAHSEVVMGVLFALHKANRSLFKTIAAPFLSTRSAEVGRIRRFAARLLLP